MSGFGDEVNSVLQSPLTQTLAPAILGGVGGALSAPPMVGRRGAIGYGLRGGAQGLERGMELAGQQQNRQLEAQRLQQDIANAQLQNQKAQWALADTKRIEAYGANRKNFTSDQEQAEYFANPDKYWENQTKLANRNADISYLRSTKAFPEDQLQALSGGDPDLVREIAKAKAAPDKGVVGMVYDQMVKGGAPEGLGTMQQAIQIATTDPALSRIQAQGQNQMNNIIERDDAAMARLMEGFNKPANQQLYGPDTKGTYWNYNPKAGRMEPVPFAPGAAQPSGNLSKVGAKGGSTADEQWDKDLNKKVSNAKVPTGATYTVDGDKITYSWGGVGGFGKSSATITMKGASEHLNPSGTVGENRSGGDSSAHDKAASNALKSIGVPD